MLGGGACSVVLISKNSIFDIPDFKMDIEAYLTALIELENSLSRINILSPFLDLISLLLDVKLDKLGVVTHTLALFSFDLDSL